MFNKIKDFLNKTIISFLKDNIKTFLFIVVFVAVCFLYNINNQHLNFVLKRGTILEYSINNQNIDEAQIEEKIKEYKIKYTYIDKADTLKIAIPYKMDKNIVQAADNISDFIFDTYKNSSLLQIKPLNDKYSAPYKTFNKFLLVLAVSFILWFIVLAIVFNMKELYIKSKEDFLIFFSKQKEGFKKLIENTKEKGIGYFLKKVLLDDSEDESTSVTKEILSTIIFVLVCVIIIRYFIGELRWIPSGSMRPTILEHDRVFVEKLEYPHKDIKRGDILVFYPPEIELSNSPLAVFTRLSGVFCKDIAFIKRVVGMPNDKFEVKYSNGQYKILINDMELDEPYINSKSDWTPCQTGMYCGPFIIPKDNYFMMGDNRGNSQDSRFWGFLDKNRVIGRATFMFWPFKRINLLKDKYFVLHQSKTFNKINSKKYILNRY